MKKLFGLSQLEEARSWDCAYLNIKSCYRLVIYGTSKYLIF